MSVQPRPPQVFITGSDGCPGGAKLLDFGLAKIALKRAANLEAAASQPTVTSHQLTVPGAAIGTLAYMSPEQARGEALDPRTDLFSFGATLHEMATGRQPFSGPTSAVVFDAILNCTPIPPARLNPEVPPGLEAIVGNALEKDRELRCQTATELRCDLKRLQRDTGATASAVDRLAAVPASLARRVSPRRVLPADLKERAANQLVWLALLEAFLGRPRPAAEQAASALAVSRGQDTVWQAATALARAWALAGQTARGRQAYQDFFALWKDADPDIPLLAQARQEYPQIQ